MKVVLDSNVLLVAIGRKGKYRPIWQAFIEGKIHLLVSEDVLHEYEEILLQYAAADMAKLVMEIFIESPDVVFKRIFYRWYAITEDEDDNKFFDLAIAGSADYLVTDDAHFNQAKSISFPIVKILSGAEFLKIIEAFG